MTQHSTGARKAAKLAGQLTQANYVAPSFNKNVNYAYNAKGALHGIGTNLIGSDPNTTTNVISAMSYKAFGAASSISYGNNRTATLSYDATFMRLTALEVARPDGSDRVLRYNYAYYENGLLWRSQDVVDDNYGRDFTYNYRNQLTKTAHYTWGTVYDTFSYDDGGNMLTRNGSSLSYATGAGAVPTTNRLTSTTYGGTTNFSYDAAGNMTAANSTTYQWDAANRLKSVNNGSLGSYGYDGNGKRVKKTESGTTWQRRESECGTRNEFSSGSYACSIADKCARGDGARRSDEPGYN
jgi:YD repeat-containing protein